jgi:hypothetical protein
MKRVDTTAYVPPKKSASSARTFGMRVKTPTDRISSTTANKKRTQRTKRENNDYLLSTEKLGEQRTNFRNAR